MIRISTFYFNIQFFKAIYIIDLFLGKTIFDRIRVIVKFKRPKAIPRTQFVIMGITLFDINYISDRKT